MNDAPDPFDALRGDLGPSDAARARLEARLSATLGVPVAGGLATTTANAAATATKGALLAKWVVPLATVALLGGGVAAYQARAAGQTAGPRQQVSVRPSEPTRALAVAAVSSPPAEMQKPAEEPALMQAPVGASEPAIAPSTASLKPGISLNSLPNTPEKARAVPAEEREIVERAQAAVRRGDGAEAMVLLDTHARLYPAGAHSEEREALAIHALRLQGNTAAADARTTRFFARYPNSLYGANLRTP
jgi:hypothetical protein